LNRDWRRELSRDADHDAGVTSPMSSRYGYPAAYETAALRSRLVANLTGLSIARLQYWHSTFLQIAHRRAGARGTPRLYSWIDYQRLCLIAGLLGRGIPTERVRVAVAYLDDLFPDWYKLSLAPWVGRVHVPGASGDAHVAIEQRVVDVLVDAGGQISFRKQFSEQWTADLSVSLGAELDELSSKGPLYQLGRYSDVVIMNPDINVGLPTLRGTRLETSFLHGLVELSSVSDVARLYHLEEAKVRRAEAFELEAAA
jgi:DNA-binding transcriptional MerR regulator